MLKSLTLPRENFKENLTLVCLLQLQRFFLFPLIVLYIATELSQFDFGVFAIGITLSQLAIVIVDYGLNQRIILVGNGKKPSIQEVMSALFLKGFVGFVFLIIIFEIINSLYHTHNLEFKIFVVSGVFYSLFNFICAYYRAQREFKIELIGVTFANLVIVIAVIFSFYFDFNVFGWAIGFLLSRFLPMVYSAVIFLKENKGKFSTPKFEKIIGDSIAVTPLAFVTILAFAYLYVDLFLIEYMLGYESVAQYQIAFRLIMLTMIVPEVFNHLMLPYLTNAKVDDELNYNSLLMSSLKLLLGYSIFAMITVYFFGPIVIKYLFGDQYDISQTLLIMMMPLILLRSIGAPLGLALLTENLIMSRMLFMASALILGMAGNLLLMPYLGLEAAVFVSIGAHIFLNFAYFCKLNSQLVFRV
jgi:O-antigen/teichoic acid export membrane protein